MANLKQYLPSIYEDVVETDALTASEEKLFDELAARILEVEHNNFIVTAQERGVKQYEDLLGIVKSPSDTLEFRRQRLLNRFAATQVFTMKSLKNKLDSILGVGSYSVYMDTEQDYTLVVESSAENQAWYHELLVTINNSKPANIVFINKPLLNAYISTGESISYSERLWNYKVGNWDLGALPFVSYHPRGEVKTVSTSSIQTELLNDIASYTANDIAKVRVNGTDIITTGITATPVGNKLTVEYTIPQNENRQSITQIELLDADNKVLTSAPVYIPALSDLTMKHTIEVREG